MQTPEEEDVFIFENVGEINYYKYEHICGIMLIFQTINYLQKAYLLPI